MFLPQKTSYGLYQLYIREVLTEDRLQKFINQIFRINKICCLSQPLNIKMTQIKDQFSQPLKYFHSKCMGNCADGRENILVR